MSITDQSFAYVAELAHRETAMHHARGKEHVVEARLLPLALAAGCSDVNSYVARLRGEDDPVQRQLVVDALTTNETSWYRDNTPFIALATAMLPALLERRAETRHLRFWSAACASGQEPYSLAMVLDERLPLGWTAEIWATDVSAGMVERVRAGRYSQVEMNRGLPATSLVKYFSRVGAEWQVDARLRELVRAERVNLAAELPPMPTFDLVLLRNVLLYFDDETTRQVADRVRAVTAPDGYLVLGASEAATDLGDGWASEACGRITVQRPHSATTAAPPATTRSAQERLRAHSLLMTGA